MKVSRADIILEHASKYLATKHTRADKDAAQIIANLSWEVGDSSLEDDTLYSACKQVSDSYSQKRSRNR